MSKKTKRCETKVITNTQKVLKSLRQDQGLTLKQAGEKLGLSLQAVDAIEQGRVYLTDERIEEIIKAYDLTMLDFKRMDRVLKREKTPRREANITVMTNRDRRSYQKVITKECRVLKSLRMERGLSQDQASAVCGYPRATIGHIENGRIQLDQSRLRYIVSSYGLEFEKFLKLMGEESLRNEILDKAIERLKSLPEDKLKVVVGVIMSL